MVEVHYATQPSPSPRRLPPSEKVKTKRPTISTVSTIGTTAKSLSRRRSHPIEDEINGVFDALEREAQHNHKIYPPLRCRLFRDGDDGDCFENNSNHNHQNNKLIILGSMDSLSRGSLALQTILDGMKAKGLVETLLTNALSIYV